MVVREDNGTTPNVDTDQIIKNPAVNIDNLSLGDTGILSGGNTQTGSLLDLEELSLSQTFDALVNTEQIVTDIPVGRRDNQTFVRAHPNKENQLITKVLEDKVNRDTFLVDRKLWGPLHVDLTTKVLITAITRQNQLFLWPIRLPGENGTMDPWNQSALEAARVARDRWVRVVSNMAKGSYDVFKAVEELPEPEWPDLTFQEIIDIAFKGKYINDLNHPVLRRLRGEF